MIVRQTYQIVVYAVVEDLSKKDESFISDIINNEAGSSFLVVNSKVIDSLEQVEAEWKGAIPYGSNPECLTVLELLQAKDSTCAK